MATARKKATANVFTNRKASVSIHRNGLSIEIGDVPAVDAGVVAKELLDMVRNLQRIGYEELVADAGGVHGGVLEVQDEQDAEDFVLPPESRRVGFIR